MAVGMFDPDDNPFAPPDKYGPGSPTWISLVDAYLNGGPAPPGMTLAQIRALNAAVRKEIREPRQLCNAAGGFVTQAGNVCLFGEAATTKANEILNNPDAPQGIKDKAQRWLDANPTEETDTGETEEETKTLQDYIDEFGEDVVNTAQGIYDDVGGFIEGAKDDPLGTLVSILDVVVDAGIPEKCQDLQDCKTADPAKGTYCWKDCVNFSVLAGIPGLPSLPGMQDVGTYRDFEDAVKEIGTTIGDVIEGNANCGENNDQDCTVSQVLTDAGTWVMKKIEGVFKDIDDASIDDAYDWIKGIFGAAVGGFVFSQVKEEIEDLFFPIAPPDDTLIDCADYGREGGEVSDVNECGNCKEKGVEPGEDGRCRRVIKDDFEDDDDEVDVSEVETTCKREGKKYNDLLDECGDCIQEGYAPGADGVCEPVDGDAGTGGGDDTTEVYDPDCETDPRPTGLLTFNLLNKQKIWDQKCGGTVDTGGDDSGTDTGGDEVFDLPCPDGYKRFNGECDLPCPTNPSIAASDPRCGGTTTGTPTFTVVCGQKEPYAPTGNAIEYNAAYREYEADYNEKCGQTGGPPTDGEDVPPDEPAVTCDDPAATNFGQKGACTYRPIVKKCEDPNALNTGKKGPCKYDTSDPCLSADYAAANPTECGTAPLDCSDPAYAAANPDECGTTPPPETSSGGGGGGGGAGGASGMFDLESFEITGDPQLLAKMEFPITDFLSGSMFKDYV
jgi:hypothetical protein